MRRLVTVEEFERIPVGGTTGRLTPDELLHLEKTWEARTGKGSSRFFDYGPASVAAKNWIGTLQSAKVRLEVSPPGTAALDRERKKKLDYNLSQMLRIALGVGALRLTEGGVAAESSLFDQSVNALCDRVLLARRRRIMREYGARTQPSKTIRGRIVFPDQSIAAVRRPGAFISSWVELHEDVPANRFLKGALRVLRARVGLASQRRVDEVLAQLDGVSLPSDPIDELQRIRADRLPSDYRAAIELARDLLHGHAAGLFAGSFSSESQVVYTPDLFEGFLFRVIYDIARSFGLQAMFQVSGRALGEWESGPFEGGDFVPIIPDIELRPFASDAPVLLIDAKWKWPKQSSKGLGLSRSDIHQMVAYASRIGCTRAALVYPSIGKPPEASGHPIRLSTNPPISLTTVFIPLLWDRISDLRAVLAGIIELSVAESILASSSH